MKQKETEEVTFIASLPPIMSAITLDGNGDGARIKLDVPRSDVLAVLVLQGWAERSLVVTIRPESDSVIRGISG